MLFVLMYPGCGGLRQEIVWSPDLSKQTTLYTLCVEVLKYIYNLILTVIPVFYRCMRHKQKRILGGVGSFSTPKGFLDVRQVKTVQDQNI